MRATSATGSRGFTLLELMVVMAIVALMAVAFPFALDRAMPGRRVDVAAQSLVSAIREVQSRSIACACPVELAVHDHAFVVNGPANGSFTRRPARLSIPAAAEVKLSDLNGRSLETFTAFSDGSVAGARFEIVSGAHRKTVSVSDLTGRVLLEDMK